LATTVQNIIEWVDRKYPNQETDANMIDDLNVIYRELFNEIQYLTDSYIIYEGLTISGQITYSLPTRSKIYGIQKMLISEDTTANVTTSTVWNEANYAGLSSDLGSGYYYGRVAEDTFALVYNGGAPTTSNLVIKIFYYKIPETLSAVTDELDLDDRYANLLRYRLVNSIASQGANPDTEIADYYEVKYQEEMERCIGDLNNRFNNAPNEDTQVKEWF